MGRSTNGELWYGVVFEEDAEFPWDVEPFDGDLEDWWRAEHGFDHAYPREGWLEAQKAFDAAHPCPVETVNYCSGDYPMYGLAVKGTVTTAYRGTPKRIEGLGISEAETQPFKDFLAKYELKPEGEAGWWLSSYWG